MNFQALWHRVNVKMHKSNGQTCQIDHQTVFKNVHNENRMKWEAEYKKTKFSTIHFTSKCYSRLDGSDGQSKD